MVSIVVTLRFAFLTGNYLILKMDVIFRVLAFLIFFSKVAYVAEEVHMSKERKSGENEDICLQCEKKRIVIIEKVNFLSDKRLKTERNASQPPKCYHQSPQFSYKKVKRKINNVPMYDKISRWFRTFWKVLSRNDDNKDCVNCQKITIIKRDKMKRSQLKTYLFSRIFQFFRSLDQCPNNEYKQTNYFSKKKRKINLPSTGFLKTKLISRGRKGKVCLNCKGKRIFFGDMGKNRKESKFTEYIMLEVFRMKQWEVNVVYCLNITACVDRIFKQAVRLPSKKKNKFANWKMHKKTNEDFNRRGDTEWKTSRLDALNTKNTMTGNSQRVKDEMTFVIMDRYSYLKFWIVLRLRCTLKPQQKRTADSTMKLSTKWPNLEKTKRIKEFLKFKSNDMYSYVPFWSLFRLHCPLLFHSRDNAENISHSSERYARQTSSLKNKAKDLLTGMQNEKYSFFPFLVLCRVKCSLVLPKKEEIEISSNVMKKDRLMKRTVLKRKVKNFFANIQNENHSFMGILILFRLKCRSVLLKKDSIESSSKVMKKSVRDVFGSLQYEKYSFMSFLVLFRLKCRSALPKKQTVEGSPMTNVLQTSVAEKLSKSPIKEISNKNLSYLPLWSILKLKSFLKTKKLGMAKALPSSLAEYDFENHTLKLNNLRKLLAITDDGKYSSLPFPNLFRFKCVLLDKNTRNQWSIKQERKDIRISESKVSKFVKNLLHVTLKRQSFIPFGNLFLLKCVTVSDQSSTVTSKFDNLMTKKQLSRKLFTPYSSELISGYILPAHLLKCSSASRKFDDLMKKKQTSRIFFTPYSSETNSGFTLPNQVSKCSSSATSKFDDLMKKQMQRKLFTPYLSDMNSGYVLPNHLLKCSSSLTGKFVDLMKKKKTSRKLFTPYSTETNSGYVLPTNLLKCSSTVTCKYEYLVKKKQLSRKLFTPYSSELISGYILPAHLLKCSYFATSKFDDLMKMKQLSRKLFTSHSSEINSGYVLPNHLLKYSPSLTGKLDDLIKKKKTSRKLFTPYSTEKNSGYVLPAHLLKCSAPEYRNKVCKNVTKLGNKKSCKKQPTYEKLSSRKLSIFSTNENHCFYTLLLLFPTRCTAQRVKYIMHRDRSRLKPSPAESSENVDRSLQQTGHSQEVANNRACFVQTGKIFLLKCLLKRQGVKKDTVPSSQSSSSTVQTRDDQQEDNEIFPRGDTVCLSADIVVLFTLLAMACYRLIKDSFGNLLRRVTNAEDNPNNEMPPDKPDETPEALPEEEIETPSNSPAEDAEPLELETVVAVADIFMKSNGKIGFKIRRSALA